MAVVSLALGSVAQSVNAASHNSSLVKRILVLGDSLLEGFGLRSDQAYPALLTEKLRAAGLNFEIINASQSGGTTEGGLRRLPAHLKRKIDIFILELGINDAFRAVPIAEIRNNLQAIIDMVKARNSNVHIIIAGMQLPNYASDDYVFAFGQIYVELAAKNNGALIPYLLEGVGGDPLLNQPDHVHPNAVGAKNSRRKCLASTRTDRAGSGRHPECKRQTSPTTAASHNEICVMLEFLGDPSLRSG